MLHTLGAILCYTPLLAASTTRSLVEETLYIKTLDLRSTKNRMSLILQNVWR